MLTNKTCISGLHDLWPIHCSHFIFVRKVRKFSGPIILCPRKWGRCFTLTTDFYVLQRIKCVRVCHHPLASAVMFLHKHWDKFAFICMICVAGDPLQCSTFPHKFKVCKSVHHHIIQIIQSTRRNNFSSLLLDVYSCVQLNLFRASSRPSSGAQQLQ